MSYATYSFDDPEKEYGRRCPVLVKGVECQKRIVAECNCTADHRTCEAGHSFMVKKVNGKMTYVLGGHPEPPVAPLGEPLQWVRPLVRKQDT